ncbi:cytosolic Fe-S cluster assembly factor Nubp2 homolog 2-like isoform X2 [Halichondria panicea]|uniref:cytosolic Fe-S cluster assembly factor Nubp2 homolog 2-like isoform X2 n=1 Tax=Halichondria panicea TaxID=6063 RepID=UPI00312B2C06
MRHACARGPMEIAKKSDVLIGYAAAVGCPAESCEAGKAGVCQGCPGRELCLQQQGGVDEDQKYINVRMKAIKKKILVLSGKGGVGKSTVAACLGMALAKLNTKVGILDLDICGPSIPKLLAVEGQAVVNSQYGWTPLRSPHSEVKVMSVGCLLGESDSPVVWRGPRKSSLIKQFLKDTFWGRLDYLIFDTPPGTSDEHLTVVKMLLNVKPEGAILVTTPQDVALATIRKEISFCRKMSLNIIGIVGNMASYVCPCCKEESPIFTDDGGVQSLCNEYSIPFLGTVPLDPVTSIKHFLTGSGDVL